jgi:antitoxin component YwqK of YwqJK toxin-antitoxin module
MKTKTSITLIVFLLTAILSYCQTDTVVTYTFSNGKPMWNGILVNGNREGLWKQYSENGYVRWIWTYINGKKDGIYYSYYENGSVEAIGFNKNELPYGLQKVYDQNGKLVCEITFEIQADGRSLLTSQKLFDPKAKSNGTIETIDGKTFVWQFGKLEQAIIIQTTK